VFGCAVHQAQRAAWFRVHVYVRTVKGYKPAATAFVCVYADIFKGHGVRWRESVF
jgi:hypothetical protein